VDSTNINNYDVLWCINKRIIMSKKYIQKPAEKPGAMILEELREQEIINGDLVWNEDTQKYDYKLNTITNG
jgi:hypothetical protein